MTRDRTATIGGMVGRRCQVAMGGVTLLGEGEQRRGVAVVGYHLLPAEVH